MTSGIGEAARFLATPHPFFLIMQRPKSESGFTLLKIMLVVMIIANLVGGAVVMFASNLTFSAKVKTDADIKTIS